MPLGYLFYGIICNIEERHTLQKDSRNPFKQTIPAIIFILDFVSFENNRPNFPSEIKKKTTLEKTVFYANCKNCRSSCCKSSVLYPIS